MSKPAVRLVGGAVAPLVASLRHVQKILNAHDECDP